MMQADARTAGQPMVCFGLPVFNGERYLEKCLDSLLAQTFEDFEIRVCDNASSDRTEEICRDYLSRDKRVKYHRHASNLGGPRNFNHSFAISEARLFKWAAHDDELRPSYLERCVALLEGGPDFVGAHTDVELIGPESESLEYNESLGGFVDEAGRVRRDKVNDVLFDHSDPVERFRSIIRRRVWHPVWGLYRREQMARTGLLRPFWGNDKAFIVEMGLQGAIGIVDEKLFRMRCHAASAGNLPFTNVNRWLKGNNTTTKPLEPQIAAVKAYAAVISNAPLNPWQKLRCAMTLFEVGLGSNKWNRQSFLGAGSLLASVGIRSNRG